MKFLIVFACAVATIAAGPLAPTAHVVELTPPEDEFIVEQSNDVDGSYVFSFATDTFSKKEHRFPDGTIVGAYQYIDADGVLQKVQYQAGKNGVQLLGTNLPVGSTDPVTETPEVIKQTENHFHLVQRQLQLLARAAALNAEYRKKHPEQFVKHDE